MIKKAGETETVIERSRFITYVARAFSEEEAQNFIAAIKKKHWDATHNCSCYMIGDHDLIQKANDDGEPSGTAGVPMLEVLKKRSLKNTVVVVTRYFGGIKLGAGGLIRAYSKSTVNGINETGVIERKKMQRLSLRLDYTWVGKMENFFSLNSSFHVQETIFTDSVTWVIDVDASEKENSTATLTDYTQGKGMIHVGEEVFSEIDVILPNS
ncbi:MAG: YigZ family protein [Bacilli bacterium]